MTCYFQGCTLKGTTKEHIPPRSFFPEGEKDQLLTVKSCTLHNNAKSKDDLYVLAQICMNASPSNRAREVFQTKVAPQLDFNNDALRRRLIHGAQALPNGHVKYQVDVARLDDFFTALSCGIVYKSCKATLPAQYKISHLYQSLENGTGAIPPSLAAAIEQMYAGAPLDFLEFGDVDTRNERIYSVKVFGLPGYQSSITLVHLFFGTFKVTSMLSL